ncbi:MAG TPA: type II toxin-antitoxin system Phd/YefM family antitoxin [Candidatus Baltobacteraceae bacterium]|nr:type II toxin-antitoxin system Phd/YefM family antitoxin [Candidatus Baltobacteraceae bacterium]
MVDWQVQEAKAELSAVIKAAQSEPQVITRHGEPVAVVVSYTHYEVLRLKEGRQPLVSFLQSWPDFEIPARDESDHGRNITL